MTRIGIVGGGPAGAMCARILADKRVDVTVLDKGKRPGGRLSTRAYDHVHYDHGAQFMTVRHETIGKKVRQWQEAGVIAPWLGRREQAPERVDKERPGGSEVQRWVGTPGMSALVAHLLRDLPCHFSATVTQLKPFDGKVALYLEDQDPMLFDKVVVAVPAPQAVPLLKNWPEIATKAKTISYHPCWAVLAEFPKPYPGDWISTLSYSSKVRWIARNQTKPGRPPKEAWVIHASPEWSKDHLEDTGEAVAEALLASAHETSKWEQQPSAVLAHRWRYAKVEQPLGVPFLYESGVGLCGDGLLGGRIESALRSGMGMAERLLGTL